ncbi:MAG: transporter related [Acidobacteria bacterium]|nr:transporter related [Acidobacteriota bacterium]
MPSVTWSDPGFLTPSSVPLRRQTDSASRWTYSFIRPYRREVAALGVLSLAEIALRAFAPWPLKAIIDYLGHTARLPRLFTTGAMSRHPALLIAAIVMAGLIVQLMHQLVLLVHTRRQAQLGQSMVFDLRSRLFTHLQNLSLAHHATGSAADSVYRLDADASCIEGLLLRGLFPLVFSGATLVVMFGILLRLDAPLALISMSIVPLLYFNLRRSARRMESGARSAKSAESAVITRLYESLSAISLVKMFAREEHEADRFSGVARAAIRERMAVTRHESFFSFAVGAITVAGASLVLGVGAVHVLDGRLTVGTLLVVMSYLGFVYGPLSAIATTAGSLHSALTSARRVREVLRLPREADPHAGAAPTRLRGEVRFDAVTFAYGPGRTVLRDVSFVAAPGETVALVGLSGAGKTTLVSLLARLYVPSTGSVAIDGVDVGTLPLRSLREQIAVVPQESILLSGSIADNILYGRLEANRDEVIAAAVAAECAAFIERLPEGYDTPLGASGAGLSGGQRQRLSIARAFLKDAPILILDEPTASLDLVAERKLLDALARLRRGRTTFVIAHRLSTIRDADRILVLDSGSITAQGRHEQLLESSGMYRRLCDELSRDAAAAGDRRPNTRRA